MNTNSHESFSRHKTVSYSCHLVSIGVNILTMLKPHEILGFMTPATAIDILSFTFESDKPAYRAVLNAVAEAKHVRPVFLERQPRAERHVSMIGALSKPVLDAAAGAMLRAWLVSSSPSTTSWSAQASTPSPRARLLGRLAAASTPRACTLHAGLQRRTLAGAAELTRVLNSIDRWQRLTSKVSHSQLEKSGVPLPPLLLCARDFPLPAQSQGGDPGGAYSPLTHAARDRQAPQNAMLATVEYLQRSKEQAVVDPRSKRHLDRAHEMLPSLAVELAPRTRPGAAHASRRGGAPAARPRPRQAARDAAGGGAARPSAAVRVKMPTVGLAVYRGALEGGHDQLADRESRRARGAVGPARKCRRRRSPKTRSDASPRSSEKARLLKPVVEAARHRCGSTTRCSRRHTGSTPSNGASTSWP